MLPADATALPPRERRLAELTRSSPDVVVVGGGATGAGIALDLRLRGLDVVLVERGDWAGSTSSASSRLIHGGLRYLEQMDVGLVRESCLERGLLLRNAAGLVWPERFTFPIHRRGPVGRWKLAAGLWLYTAVSVPRVLGLPHALGQAAVARAVPGIRREALTGGGDYLDGATDDARLVLAIVATAIENGVLALPRMEVGQVEQGGHGVALELEDRLDGTRHELTARCAVLAGGPHTDALRARAALPGGWLSPTRGSHVLVPRERLPTDGAVILNSAVDGRVMFLIPRPRFTVIGTTDLDAAPEADVRATRAEVRYLLDSANALVPPAALSEEDVVSTWAGLRPLLRANESDPSARTREERIASDGSIYTIAGGKLTGYRSMAEKLGARIAQELGKGSAARRSPTRHMRLHTALGAPVARPTWSRLDPAGRVAPEAAPRRTAWAQRYAGASAAVERLCAEVPEGDAPLSADTWLGEVDWAVRHEDCLRTTDFLFRRTDLGLERPEAARASLERVNERLAAHLDWDPHRADRERRRALAALEIRAAWRDD